MSTKITINYFYYENCKEKFSTPFNSQNNFNKLCNVYKKLVFFQKNFEILIENFSNCAKHIEKFLKGK